MTRKLLLLSTVALGLTPALALAGGEVMVPPPPAPAPVPVAPVVQPPAPAPVVMDDEGGPYVALYGGASWLQDSDGRFDSDDPAFDGDTEIDFDTGWIAGASAGYQANVFGFEPRIELDGAYRQHDVDGGSFGAFDFDGDDVDGDVRAVSGLVNAWFDVPVGAAITPYVGGGVGAAWIDADDVSFNGVTIDDEDTVFAWQLGAGVGYQFTPDWTATVDYRWFNAENTSFSTGDEKLGLDYETHNVMAGLRYTF